MAPLPYAFAPFDVHPPNLDAVIALCRTIWGSATGAEPPIRRHANYPGFKGVVALAPDGQIAGFAYGTTVLPGMWWSERIAPRITHGREGSPATRARQPPRYSAVSGRAMQGVRDATALSPTTAPPARPAGARIHDRGRHLRGSGGRARA